MSSQTNWNLDPVTLLIIVLSLVVSATYTLRPRKSPLVDKLSLRVHLEVLAGAEDESSKSNRPVVDVIAVHGLGSTYPQTWTRDDKMWLKDFLPIDFPAARVLAFVYPPESSTDGDLRSPAISLLRAIVNERADLYLKRTRPIIFVGHSSGGLVIKNALVLSQSPDPVVEGCGYIANVTRGIVFLGTPHTRPKYALSTWAFFWSQLSGLFGGPYARLLMTLRLLYPEPERVNQDFLAIPAIRELPKSSLVSFYETKSLFLGSLLDRRSACLEIGTHMSLDADHEDMNKFSDPQGPYNEVKNCLQKIYDPLVNAGAPMGNNAQYTFDVKTDTPGFDLFDCFPTESWSEANGRMCLSMGGSGTSGCLIFMNRATRERFAVTLGVHNYAPWEDIATKFGDETAQDIRDSFYDKGKQDIRDSFYDKGKSRGKRNVWDACDGRHAKLVTLMKEKSVNVTFEVVEGEKRYLTEVVVK